MRIFIARYPDEAVVVLTARAEGPGAVGDFRQEVRPGESAFGRTYEQWAAYAHPTFVVPAAPPR